jgi:hypothetical protein
MTGWQPLLGPASAAVIFAGAFTLAHVGAGHIELPFSNPNGVVGTLTEIAYNPSNNILRFLLITLLPTAVLAALFCAGPEPLASHLFTPRQATADVPGVTGRTHRPLVLALTMALTLLVALHARSYMSSGQFETYEEGLPLSAGMSYLNGGVPYRDFAFFHGLYDEPLRVAAAFTLFGPSIGAMRTFQSINKLITYGLMALFLYHLFRRGIAPVILVLLVFHYLEPRGAYESQNRAGIPILHSVIVMPRDLALFAFLATFTFLAERIRRSDFRATGILWITVAWSCLPGLGFIHSMERGVYLMLAFMALAPACHVFFFRHTPAARPFLIGCAIGLALSAAILIILIDGAVPELLRLAGFLGSDAIELQFSHPYPYWDQTLMGVDVMIALCCFWVSMAFFTHWRTSGLVGGTRNFLREHFMELTLMLVSMLFYKNALGRSDWIHVAYGLPAPTILFLYLVTRYALMPMSRRIGRARHAVAAAFWILISIQGLVLLYGIPRGDLIRENFPLTEDDSRYLPARWKPLVAFLRDNLSHEESFYLLSDEISLYYFVGRVCPVRFPLLTMVASDPTYQREIIEDVASHKVKYVVIDPKSIYFRIDNIANDLRAPLVFNYVRAHYRQHRDIEGQLVLIRNAETH